MKKKQISPGWLLIYMSRINDLLIEKGREEREFKLQMNEKLD